MASLPVYVPLLFAVAVVFTLFALYRASSNSKAVLIVAFSLIALQSLLAAAEFYLETDTKPPRFVLLPLPPLILIVVLFSTRWGKGFLDSLDIKWLTWLHVVRLPVELVLFGLFIGRLVPQEMTFEGRNFDIFSGVTAILVYYVIFYRDRPNRKLLIGWNLVCLLLLLNIVVTSVLAAPSPIQQLAFEQPNTGVLYFPFVLLPAFIVPAVLLAHLAALRQLFGPHSSK